MYYLLCVSLPLFCSGLENLSPVLLQCEDWDKEYPEENGVTNECKMKVKQRDVDEFLFRLRKDEFTTRLFKFRLIFQKREILQTKCVIEPFNWVWTFPGVKGAMQFLKWPNEYSVWSLGLLDSYSQGPMNISIDVSNNCTVIIGQNETTQRIGLALTEMVNKAADLPSSNVEYGFGSVCYQERIYIQNPLMYKLCLHIVCPFEALGYKCCRTEYVYQNNTTRVVCDGRIVHFDDAWWVVPFLVGILMFAYVPILLVKQLQNTREKRGDNVIDLMEQNTNTDVKWLIANPLSFCSIIQAYFVSFAEIFPRLSGIFMRILIIFSCLFILVVQLLMHYFYDYKYTIALVEAGVPLAFRSMISGYNDSKDNFMPRLGGPFVALEIYLITTVILVCIPRDLETFINKGIPNNDQLSVSPLTIDLKTRGKLGAVYDIERQSGFQKLYSLMKSHIFMLINPSFWRLVIQMQFRRFTGLINITASRKTVKVMLTFVLFIPYFCIFCVIESFLTVMYYGFPIFLFFQVTVCAYCNGIKTKFGSLGTFGKIIQYILTTVVVAMLVFNIYILTVVFIDSFHFITRIIIFTFTGLIAYPSTTYGYFVFAITVMMYVAESIQQIRTGYSKLFTYVRKCCLKVCNRNAFPNVPIILNKNGFNMISRELFYFVVSRHRPIRVEIFFSVLKLVFITFLLYLAIHTIVQLQGLWNINPLTQVVTAIFICLVPKLWHKMMHEDGSIFAMRETLIIGKLINDYCQQKLHCREGHTINNVESDNSENENEDRALLDCSTTYRRYDTLNIQTDETEDNEMRSDLLLDMANDL